ncbi:MAG: hypothetical protein LAN62_01765 [Acidobacteriia bacterium]|nr:hypothetical protein [Terriglobia bacterium]
MIRRAWLLLLLVGVSPLPTKGGADKGKVLCPPTLARVESYCVDTRRLSADEAYVVKAFLKMEDKPKGILQKLRWKRIEDCAISEADVTIRIEFPFLNATELRAGEVPDVGISPREPRDQSDVRISPREQGDYFMKAVLQVHDNSTSRMIFTVEALPLDIDSVESDPVMKGTNLYQRRLDALRRTFEMLIHDLGPVPPTTKEAR